MKQLNVLSIDMDFFQDVDLETLMRCYPDGHDFASPMLAQIIWGSHYSNPFERDNLSRVKCPEDLFEELKCILSNQNSLVPVRIAQSHLRIYNFICNQAAERGCITVDVTNIDMHHDMFTDNRDSIDCGNWLNAIRNLFDTKVKWISHPVSSEMMDDKRDDKNVEVIVNSFDSIKDKQFDIIFLCRSDLWYAPHLDNKFEELVNYMQQTFKNVTSVDDLVDRRGFVEQMSSSMESAFNELV